MECKIKLFKKTIYEINIICSDFVLLKNELHAFITLVKGQ